MTFTWPYAAFELPNIVLLGKGKVMFSGKMKPNDQETSYSITLIVKGDRDYDYFYEVDGERRYDFDAAYGPADLFNYAAPVEDTENMVSAKSKGKIIRSQIIIANSIRIRSALSSAASCSSSSSRPSSPQPKVPEIMWPKKVVSGQWLAFEKIPMFSTGIHSMTTTGT
jgi:hypothetical protein